MAMDLTPTVGYMDKLRFAPGETAAVRVSAPGDVSARLVHLTSDGVTPVVGKGGIFGPYAAGVQSLPAGSCMTVDAGVPMPDVPEIHVSIWPTAPVRGEQQGIISWGWDHGLFLDQQGRAIARWAGAAVSTTTPLIRGRWTNISLSLENGVISLSAQTVDGGEQFELATVSTNDENIPNSSEAAFCLGAISDEGGHHSHFDGKIARPEILDQSGFIARWAFEVDPHSATVIDKSDHVRHGTLFNRPQRGMTGPRWSGDSSGWREAPEEYDAIAFHSDDLTDACWPVTFEFAVPADLPSGAYGLEIIGDNSTDTIPFFVIPPAGTSSSRLAFIAPTFSYLAYANERHWWPNPGVEAIAGAPLDDIIGPLERWAEQQGLISLYDYHSDGTGNAHASFKRPLVNVRHDYIHPLLRGPHQLSGDVITLDWLKQIGQPVDILTDECLHERGLAALEPYDCVITGSHPEYVTSDILDALEGYAKAGGNILHMGGNAFYFVVSVYAEEPHVIEVRRGPGGTIPWQSEPGEFRHTATGELGGIWRWRGRSAHQLVGTGTSAVSFGTALPFSVEPDALKNPETSWIFEGVSACEIKAGGRLFNGPAGFEVDAMRHDLGTPSNTVKLAQASDFGDMAFQTLDDVIGTGPLCTPSCDLAYRQLRAGGQIFSAPSISWTSCLLGEGGDNAVAKVTRNVLERFLDQ